MPKRIVAIHQPNFFPWLGYFDKIARADVFCFLNTVQFPKTGGTWTNRVRLAVAGRPTWVTVPIDRAWSGVRTIAQIRIRDDQPWRKKLVATLRCTYGRTPFFQEVFPLLRELILTPNDNLAEYNQYVVRQLAEAIGMNRTQWIRSSDLAVTGTATPLLINIVRAVGGSAYLCGGGAQGYQDDAIFAKAGIELLYQDFAHPRYKQGSRADFIAGLSIMDALMHCGFDGVHQMLSAALLADGDEDRKAA